MELGKAFGYVFDDEEWLSVLLIGFLLMFIPIVNVLLLWGFTLEAARNVQQGVARPLPKWNNFGEKLRVGLHAIVIQLFYTLPLVLFGLLAVCIFIGLALATQNQDPPFVLYLGLASCVAILSLLLSVIFQPLMLAALTYYVETWSLGKTLRFGEVWQYVRVNLGQWVILWLVQLLCGVVAGIGSIAFGIGALLTLVYSQAVLGHVLGQVAGKREA
jgi:hypothetical protein